MANLEDLDAEMTLNVPKLGEPGKGATTAAMPALKPTAPGATIFELSGAQISNDLQQTVPIVPGQCYRFQFRINGISDGGGVVAELAYLNAGGGTLASYSASANPGSLETDAWISYLMTTAPAPASSTQVRLRFMVQGRTKSLQLADVALAVDEPPK